MGCLTLFVLLAFLAFAFVGGGLWALNHFRNTYSSTEPAAIPAAESPAVSAPASQTASTPSEAAPAVTATAPVVAGTPIAVAPVPAPTPIVGGDVQARWEAFQRAGHRGEKASIALSGPEINTLLANGSKTRGKVFVSVQGTTARVQASIPLKNVAFMKGRYLNGEATVQASPDGDPAKAQITNITLANQAVPENVLDQRLFSWSPARGMIQQWLDDQNIAVFKIENGQVIGETRGN